MDKLQKDKLIEKVNQEKAKEESEIKKRNEKLNKKYKHKDNNAIEQALIHRLYKEDVNKRAYKKQLMNSYFLY